MCKIQDTNIVTDTDAYFDTVSIPVLDTDATIIQIKDDLYEKNDNRHDEKIRNIHMVLKDMQIIENDDISFMTNETSNSEKIQLLQTYNEINNVLISYIINY
jgi:phosphatidylserine/phosphatidylglycerophosphate/cardiolipin synthase-like enzyme